MAEQHVHIELKTPRQIDLMRAAGLVVADTLAALRAAAAPGVSTAYLDSLAEERIRAAGAVPSFKGYHGYPASICTSVNEQVVHGIPSAGQVLRDGDLISIDCGAMLAGWHGDAAITVPIGEVSPAASRMLTVAEDALWAGIAAAARGVRSHQGRLTDISSAIQSSIEGAGRFGIVRDYGGHGIGSEMHEEPFVFNVGCPGLGPSLLPGVTLAIEPMVTLGQPDVLECSDGWTVVTADRSVAVHVEHTIALLADGALVLTAADGGRSRLGDLLASAQSGQVTPTNT